MPTHLMGAHWHHSDVLPPRTIHFYSSSQNFVNINNATSAPFSIGIITTDAPQLTPSYMTQRATPAVGIGPSPGRGHDRQHSNAT
jgi:hypothetical protein